jgi:hypothetical protein
MAVGNTYLASSLLVGQSANALISAQTPDESLTLILTVASIPATSQAKVRLVIRDPFQPADARPILDVFAEAGTKKVKIEPVAQVLAVTVTSLLGPVAVSVVESVEPVKTTGLSSGFRAVTASGAATTVDLSLGQNINLLLLASTTLTLTNPVDGTRYLFRFLQGAGGTFTVAWPAPGVTDGVRWRAKTPPVITALAASIDYAVLIYNFPDRRFDGSYDQDFG